jgi:alcohol dehydrogenase
VATNIAALEAREPDAAALAVYADAGRILADVGPEMAAASARASLVATLRTLVTELGIPRLSAFGMTTDHIPAVVADSPGSSMRSNPVALSDRELESILEEAL